MPNPPKAALVAAAAVAAAVVALPTSANAATHGWRVTQTFRGATSLSVGPVSIASRKDGWLFGVAYRIHHVHPADVPVSYHWNGSRWKYVAMPKNLDGFVADVSIRSASDAWAVSGPGETGGEGPNAVLHWNGKRWSIVKRDLPGFADSINAFSSKNVWVFGAPGANKGSGTWHYNGRSWKRVKTGTFLPGQTSATSSTNLWARGRDSAPGKDMKTVARFDGRKWTIMTLGVPVWSLKAESPQSVWATGCQYEAKQPNSLLHWNGRSWKRMAAPGAKCLGDVTPDGQGGLWFVSQDAKRNSVLVHRTKAGKWSTVRVPGSKAGVFVDGLARVPGTTTIWGASTVDPDGKSFGQLLRYS
ncbi:hypothetical protein [Actinomadura rupiterrae]|uniref:hypothetical protein n=1 Tax=Actinomadura rupiterrae TaxID=559627 RepID=UPI0020A5E7CA|nr:hypothetical protein [Actinomadura rupiterrae]MCP2343009.1 hypothetical protein [Actinomadura rupiterrae]